MYGDQNAGERGQHQLSCKHENSRPGLEMPATNKRDNCDRHRIMGAPPWTAPVRYGTYTVVTPPPPLSHLRVGVKPCVAKRLIGTPVTAPFGVGTVMSDMERGMAIIVPMDRAL